jgi:HD-like signal output (HDOD) protein
MSPKAASVFEKLQHKGHLPYIRTVIFQILQRLREPDVEAADIAKLLRKEPLIASKVSQMANRLKAGRNPGDPSLAGDLTHAVAYIGLRTLEDMLIVAFITSIEIKTEHFSIDDFWDESAVVAIISETLGRKYARDLDSLDVYLAGFLCNIGKVVSAFYLPEQTDEIFVQTNELRNSITWMQYELLHGLPDHRSLGEVACAFWGLSPKVLDAIQGHHGSKYPQSGPYQIHEIVTLGNQLAHWVQLRPERIERKTLDTIAQRFRLNSAQLDELASDLSKSIRKTI